MSVIGHNWGLSVRRAFVTPSSELDSKRSETNQSHDFWLTHMCIHKVQSTLCEGEVHGLIDQAQLQPPPRSQVLVFHQTACQKTSASLFWNGITVPFLMSATESKSQVPRVSPYTVALPETSS